MAWCVWQRRVKGVEGVCLMKGSTQLGCQQAVKEGRSEDLRRRCAEQAESRGQGTVALRK